MKNLLIGAVILCCSTASMATVDDIRSGYSALPSISNSYRATSANPGYQVTTAPSINWSPKMKLNRATGTPSISLDKARGVPIIDLKYTSNSIRGTSGVNQSIKDYIAMTSGHPEWNFNATYQSKQKPPSTTTPYQGLRCPTKGAYAYTYTYFISSGYSVRRYRCE